MGARASRTAVVDSTIEGHARAAYLLPLFRLPSLWDSLLLGSEPLLAAHDPKVRVCFGNLPRLHAVCGGGNFSCGYSLSFVA